MIVLLFATGRFVFELVQFFMQTSPQKFIKNYKRGLVYCNHLLSYVLDFINWLEIAQYVCTIVFVCCVCTSVGLCSSRPVWQLGVTSMFLGWTVLIMFISKFPKIGIYVIILVQICKTYFTMIILTILMIVTFALTFYLTFSDERVEVCFHTHIHTPLTHIPHTLSEVTIW